MSFLTQRIVVTVDHEVAVLRHVATALRRFFGLARPRAQRPRRLAPPPPPPPSKLAFLDELDEKYGTVPDDGEHARAPGAADVLLLDGSAVVALARGDGRARAYVRRAVAGGARVLVAASSLADPRVAAIAERVGTVVEIDDRCGNEAARLVSETRLALPLDALTVACAPHGVRVALLTADPAGIGALVRASRRPDVEVLAIGRRLRRG